MELMKALLSLLLFACIGCGLSDSASFKSKESQQSPPTPTPASSPSASPSPSPSTEPSPFPSPQVYPLEVGVNIHLNAGTQTRQMAVMGAQWVRIDLNWDIVEPNKGKWAFQPVDSTLANAAAANLKVLACLCYSAPWASSNGAYNGIPNVQDWENFVTKTVTRYRGKVAAWAIWNEPNLDHFWIGSTDDYIDKVLIPAHRILKNLDPKTPIVGPDLAFLSSARIGVADFFRGLKARGVDTYFDFIAQHVYASSAAEVETKINGLFFSGILIKKGLKQTLEESGLWGQAVWITEVGFDAGKTDEPTQARELADMLRFFARLSWTPKVFIYELIDDPNYPKQWGILRSDSSARPAFTAIQDLIRLGFEP